MHATTNYSHGLDLHRTKSDSGTLASKRARDWNALGPHLVIRWDRIAPFVHRHRPKTQWRCRQVAWIPQDVEDLLTEHRGLWAVSEDPSHIVVSVPCPLYLQSIGAS